MAPITDIDPSWKPTARPDVVFRQVGEEWVLFDPERQRVHVLNLTAALVWSFCTGEFDVGEIDQRVREAFTEAPASSGADEALADFRDAGLLAGAP